MNNDKRCDTCGDVLDNTGVCGVDEQMARELPHIREYVKKVVARQLELHLSGFKHQKRPDVLALLNRGIE